MIRHKNCVRKAIAIAIAIARKCVSFLQIDELPLRAASILVTAGAVVQKPSAS